jgi:aminoglycoside phosphotransferase (APT) family kinase protein
MRRLPPSLLAWVADQVDGAPLEGIQRLQRAAGSEVIGLRAGDRSLVLRWYPDGVLSPESPLEAIEREAAALTALEDTLVPAPGLVAASVESPAAVLMTRVPGRSRVIRLDPGAMRSMMALVHACDPGPLTPWTYRGYHEGQVLRRPAWWQDAPTWERAVVQTETARPTGPTVFLHRDFHPGNLLWSDPTISGVVDWVDACVGPAGVDLGHLRVNLAVLENVSAADALDAGDPAWDVEMALGFLDWDSTASIDGWAGPWPHVPAATARARLEAFVGHALARLG